MKSKADEQRGRWRAKQVESEADGERGKNDAVISITLLSF